MAPFAQINARIDARTKQAAQAVFRRLGLSMTDGIKIFLRRVVMEKGIPFDVKIPNTTTAAAMKELEDGEGVAFDSVDELFEDLDS